MLKEDILDPLVDFFFPIFCISCNIWTSSKAGLCSNCSLDLAQTDHFIIANNDFHLSIGKPNGISRSAAWAKFEYGNTVRILIHGLKYSGKRAVGPWLAEKIAAEITTSKQWSKGLDIVIPIPLHPKKERKRGYNQSYLITKRLAEILQIEEGSSYLKRQKNTDTQTRKNFHERQINIQEAFSLQKGEKLAGKHVVLIDDVITTGATMLEAAKTISEAKPASISLLAAAITSN